VNAGLKRTRVVSSGMHCHYCDREATFAAESDGLKVGLCDEHFRERLEELADADELEALRERVDVDRSEN